MNRERKYKHSFPVARSSLLSGPADRLYQIERRNPAKTSVNEETLLSNQQGDIGIRRRPTLPDRYQSSTIGTEGLNFCVRYGNRWNPFVIATGNGELFKSPAGKRCFRIRFFPRSGFQAFRSSFSSSVQPAVLSHPDNCTASIQFSDHSFNSSQNHASVIKPSTD